MRVRLKTLSHQELTLELRKEKRFSSLNDDYNNDDKRRRQGEEKYNFICVVVFVE